MAWKDLPIHGRPPIYPTPSAAGHSPRSPQPPAPPSLRPPPPAVISLAGKPPALVLHCHPHPYTPESPASDRPLAFYLAQQHLTRRLRAPTTTPAQGAEQHPRVRRQWELLPGWGSISSSCRPAFTRSKSRRLPRPLAAAADHIGCMLLLLPAGHL
jgi:hypothetical protein